MITDDVAHSIQDMVLEDYVARKLFETPLYFVEDVAEQKAEREGDGEEAKE